MAGSRLPPSRALTTGSAFNGIQPSTTNTRNANGARRVIVYGRTSNGLSGALNGMDEDEDEDGRGTGPPPFPNFSSRQESRSSNTTYAQFNNYGTQQGRRDLWEGNRIVNSENVQLGHINYAGSTMPEGESVWRNNDILGGRAVHLGHVNLPGSNPSEPRRSYTMPAGPRGQDPFSWSTAQDDRRDQGENRARRDPDRPAQGGLSRRGDDSRGPNGQGLGRRGPSRHGA